MFQPEVNCLYHISSIHVRLTTNELTTLELVKEDDAIASQLDVLSMLASQVTSFPAGLHQFASTVTQIDFSGNNIEQITEDDLRGFSILSQVHLSTMNLLHIADMTGIFDLSSSPGMWLPRGLVCDENLAWLVTLQGRST